MKQNASSLILISMMLLFCFPFQSPAKEQPFITVHVNDSTIDIEATGVALGEVLRAVSKKTGIVLKLGDPLTDAVTFSLTAVPVEEALKTLLANRNYSLSFKKTDTGEFVPTELRVIGKSSSAAINGTAVRPPLPDTGGITPGNSIGSQFTREQLGQLFGNTDEILKQMSAVPVVEGPSVTGIRLTNLADQSPLSRIGLSRGDVISDVNGKRIESVQQFLKAVQNPPEDMSVVMITRMLNARNGLSDSVYLHLQ